VFTLSQAVAAPSPTVGMQVELGALLEDAVAGHPHRDVQRGVARERRVLQDAVPHLQHAPDRQRKGRLGEDGHVQGEGDGVRVEQRQRVALRQTGEGVEAGQFRRRDAMAPARRDRRHAALQPGEGRSARAMKASAEGRAR
jgi:hypothetical protein